MYVMRLLLIQGYGLVCALQDEKLLQLQLFRLYYNEKEIDEITGMVDTKNRELEKENKKHDKIDSELKDKKKEHGKIMKELAKLDQQLNEQVM